MRVAVVPPFAHRVAVLHRITYRYEHNRHVPLGLSLAVMGGFFTTSNVGSDVTYAQLHLRSTFGSIGILRGNTASVDTVPAMAAA